MFYWHPHPSAHIDSVRTVCAESASMAYRCVCLSLCLRSKSNWNAVRSLTLLSNTFASHGSRNKAARYLFRRIVLHQYRFNKYLWRKQIPVFSPFLHCLPIFLMKFSLDRHDEHLYGLCLHSSYIMHVSLILLLISQHQQWNIISLQSEFTNQYIESKWIQSLFTLILVSIFVCGDAVILAVFHHSPHGHN